MSVGNLKTYGGKGTNMPWQLKMLYGQECTCDNLVDINNNTVNVDSLLNQILTAIQAGTEYEAALVIDANDVTWLEIRIYNAGTGTFDPPVYYLAGTNTPGTPLAPITYINPNTYLAQIVTNTTGLATETTLSNIDINLSQINLNTSAVSRTPVYFRTTTSGTIAAVTYSFSIANVGTAAGTVDGYSLPAGVTINYDPGLNNTIQGLSFDATGTIFIITYIS
jgi:hypothetical protein